jgi:formylglycine-generating enzyme required for sulfatase activity
MAKPKEFISKGRLDALTDGVFAFAMTLLVVNLDLPEDFHPSSAAELISALVDLGGTLIAYVITFLVLASFWLGRAPVTNREYLAFMNGGGYEERRFWSETGWAWLREEKARAPAHWRILPGQDESSLHGWRELTFGRLEPVHPDGIVVHVSWFEADAYARWAGGRLPSEAEWEKAAAWDPQKNEARRFPWGDAAWTPTCANLDQERLKPG